MLLGAFWSKKIEIVSSFTIPIIMKSSCKVKQI